MSLSIGVCVLIDTKGSKVELHLKLDEKVDSLLVFRRVNRANTRNLNALYTDSFGGFFLGGG